MTLTVKRAGADEYGKFVKMLVVGDPGAGKTRTASCWPDVLYANCEAGMMSVADRQPATVDITSGPQLKELESVLSQPANIREQMLGVPCQTVVLDTLDEVARIYIKERLASERKETMAIQDWGWLGDNLRNLVRAFRNLDLNVIFNVHVRSQEDSETGRTVYKPGIQGGMSDEVAAYVDLVLLMQARPVTTVVNGQNVRSISRYFQTYPDAQHPWVKDRSGKLPMEFPINFDDDYERLHGFVYASVPSAAPVVVSNLPAPAVSQAPAAPTRAAGAAKAPPAAQAPIPDADPPEEPVPAPAVEPEPELPVEPPVSAPEPEPEPAPEAPPATETAPETVPDPGTPEEAPPEPAEAPPAESETTVEEWETCQGCGGKVENKDQADLAYIRYKQHLCRKCFGEKKKAKS